MTNSSEYEDSSSSAGKEVFIPGKHQNAEELVCDYDAYEFIEDISLEWPAQSFSYISENILAVGLNADLKEKSSLIILNVEDVENFKMEGKIDSLDLNRLKFSEKFLFGVGDDVLARIDSDLAQKSIKEEFGYGFDVSPDFVAASDLQGNLKIYDRNLKILKKIKLHEKEINSIKIEKDFIFTGSNDSYLKCYDIKEEKIIFEKKFCSDINSIDLNCDKDCLLVGEDNGSLHLINLESENKDSELISWHKSPISCVRFSESDPDIFYSCSTEQVCVWDKSFDDEWEYHKYLSFTHMGDDEYKQIEERKGLISVTGRRGICFFKPLEVEPEN